jgi:pSer/pThr/pTyr-binding forkhead associated (FHA) protein
MPKLTLVQDRKTVQIYDLDQQVIRIGRIPGMDIQIDDVSVSRRQAEIQQEGERWVVRDIGSSNGTFVNGERVAGDRPLQAGDEISIGQFSLFFERGLGTFQPRRREDRPERPAPAAPAPRVGAGDATAYMAPDEIDKLQKEGTQKRQPHIVWEVGAERGTHYVGDSGGALVGKSALCDLRLPRGPRQPILILKVGEAFEARNLSFWRRMRVAGQATSRVRLRDGDVIEMGTLRLTFRAGDSGARGRS